MIWLQKLQELSSKTFTEPLYIRLHFATMIYDEKGYCVKDSQTDFFTINVNLFGKNTVMKMDVICAECMRCAEIVRAITLLANNISRAGGRWAKGNLDGSVVYARDNFFYGADPLFRKLLNKISFDDDLDDQTMM